MENLSLFIFAISDKNIVFLGKYFTPKPFDSNVLNDTSQWGFYCSKLTIETLEQGMKYV